MIILSGIPDVPTVLNNLGLYIPLVLKYYLPGYIFYRVISKSFSNSNNSESKYIIEIVISWLIVFCVDSILNFIGLSFINNLFFQISIALVTAYGFGYFMLRRFKKSNKFRLWTFKFFGYSTGSVLVNLARHKDSRARVTMKSNDPNLPLVIYGDFAAIDIENEPKFISLRRYCINNEEKNLKDFIMIPMSEVIYLEFDLPPYSNGDSTKPPVVKDNEEAIK